jgi:cytochrome oxidase Cu insertion factor (SCO1/SenC/PrrC family)
MAQTNASPQNDARLASSVRQRARRTLLWLVAVGVAPVVASYAAYHFFPRESRTNYGTLLPTIPAPALAGTRVDGAPFQLADLRGRWVLLMADSGRCDAPCQRRLYATRQARTMQGTEQERIVRLWLVIDDALPDNAILVQHPGLIVARVSPVAVGALPGGADAIYLIDPLGNLVLRYSDDPDIKGINRDLERLLKISRIG